MTDWLDSSVRPGSIVVDDGPVVVPVEPDDGIPGPGKRPCRITVRLRGVAYRGDDVGRDWRYTVTVNNSVWLSPRHAVEPNSFDAIGAEVYDRVWPDSCEGTPLIVISAHAREHDGGLFDDEGFRADIVAMRCPLDGLERQLVIAVPVPEYPQWFGRLFRRGRRVAVMVFFFVIEARCER
jgi:hypothetical protein